MLGQPVSMLVPQVVGFKLTGTLPRRGDRHRPGADRHRRCSARRASSASSSSSTATGWPACRWPTGPRSPTWPPSTARPAGSFPIDAETLRYLELSGRPPSTDRAGRGVRQGTGDVPRRPARPRPSTPTRSSSTSRRSSRAWPARKRPQDRVPLHDAKASFADGAQGAASAAAPGQDRRRRPRTAGHRAVRVGGRRHGRRRRGPAVARERASTARADHATARS